MPNKEERKHFLKKRKETTTKKGGKAEQPIISKSITGLLTTLIFFLIGYHLNSFNIYLNTVYTS